MGRLVMAKPRLAIAKPRLAKAAPVDEAERSRQRDAAHGWRSWYKTARWQRLRWSVLERDLFTCQWAGCGRVEGDTSKLVADHKVAHRGDEGLFWDAANLQCLCKGCHDRLKQAAERNQGRW
jgi:5-methylcytosine-specific restriction protein A